MGKGVGSQDRKGASTMPTRRQPADHVEPPAAEAAPRTAAPPSQEEWAVRAALQAAAEEVQAVAARLGPRFARAEARRRAQVYLRGLLSPVERKSGWQLAEAGGDRTPRATRHVLRRGGGWFVGSAGPGGCAFVARGSDWPGEWRADRVGGRRGGIPAGVGFATKPELAQAMLAGGGAGGGPGAWVTADSVYGDDRSL